MLYVLHVSQVCGVNFCELLHREEVLAVAVPADAVRTVVHDALPEGLDSEPVLGLARNLVEAREPDDLRDDRISMQAVQPVLPAHQRIKHGVVDEVLFRHIDATEVDQHLQHATVFAAEEFLNLLRSEDRKNPIEPVQELVRHLQRLRRTGITQACDHLMHRVHRHPNAVERKTTRFNLSGTDILKYPFRRSHHVAIGVLAGA